MAVDLSGQITAIAMAVLACAIVTGIYCGLATCPACRNVAPAGMKAA
jgi:hypothetical protein